MEMKQFKKFAGVLIAVVIILVIGVFFKKWWGPIVGAIVAWICACFGITTPQWVADFQDMAGSDKNTLSDGADQGIEVK